MKKLLVLITLSSGINLVYADCAAQNPSGLDAVLSCAASEAGYTNASTFWDERLFSSKYALDMFCKKSLADNVATPTTAQTEMYNKACTKEAGAYFSYDKLVAADNLMASKLGNNYTFMRTGSYKVKLQEFANFLATMAQETSGNGVVPGTKYQNDGLYYRYENSMLAQDTCKKYNNDPNSPNIIPGVKGSNCDTLSLANYYTNYFPLATFTVANTGTSATSYTKMMMDNDMQYQLYNSPVTVQWKGLPTILGGSFAAPSGYSWAFASLSMEPGYWLGMGNLQLTGDSMYKFFGWYYQNLATSKSDTADFPTFVKTFLGDGELAWLGGLWYWNYRVAGATVPAVGVYNPALHQVLSGTNAACHDIAITTRLVNGGCNDDSTRVQYYKYFLETVFKIPNTPVSYTYNGKTSTSMVCSLDLQQYCSANYNN